VTADASRMLPVVALHGFTQTGRSWDPLTDVLRERLPGADVAAPDLPGHGDGGDAVDLATAANLLAERFGRSIWVGYSMGGRHLLQLAVEHPDTVAGMVLISATAGIEDETERMARRTADESLAEHLLTIGVDAFLTEWLAQPLFAGRLPDDDRKARSTRAEGLAESLRRAGTGAMSPLWERLSTSAIPTLVITGADDPKFCGIGHRLAATIPDARHTIVDGAGHAVHLERPEVVADLISGWLAR
jgi:2-succinyl-6-hydroxy-2,4-cyclohexadiene-1-carboxylate synthase